MAYLSSVRFRNFRSFIDTGEVLLGAINILVGKNSIGKSSFARVWPLLRQSVGVKKSAPILWLGDLVDMGSYDDVACYYSNSREVELIFKILPKKKDKVNKYHFSGLFGFSDRVGEAEITTTIQLAKHASDNSSYAKKVRVSSGDNYIEINIDELRLVESIKVNNKVYLQIKDFDALIDYSTGIIPKISFFEKVPGKGGASDEYVPTKYGFKSKVNHFLTEILHRNTAAEKIDELGSRISFFGTSEEILAHMKALRHISTDTWSFFSYRLTETSPKFRQLKDIVLLASITDTFDYVSSMLSQHFSRVRYIEPIRATAERFYRHQELAVDEIDSKGSNLVFFVSSLGEEISFLNEWLGFYLKINVFAEERSGHLSLVVHDLNTNRRNNVADMGFGFSQIIPIAVQIWLSINKKNEGFTTEFFSESIVIEQPELHLHPAMQANIAEMIVGIVNAAGNVGINLNFIIETHSQHLISKLGDLVSREMISKDAINILMFEQSEMLDTNIVVSNFNPDGSIVNWPYGFFEADE